MKYLIVSDIHGCLPALEKVLQFYQDHRFDMLLILGDILNYGPRNGLPEGLNPKGIAERLNEMADEIVAIRGNCDSEVDQMLLNFPILSDYTLVVDNGKKLFLTHGHIYNKDNLPPMMDGDILIHGHTHVLKAENMGNYILLNPGSVSIPKEGNPPTYAILENGIFTIKDFEGNTVREITL